MKKRKEEKLSPLNYYKYLKKELESVALFPEREARDIVYYLTGKDIGRFLTNTTDNPDMETIFEKTYKIIERRKAGEPLEYILGKSFFMDIELVVNRSVLIPRPDTEILVEEVLRHKPGKVIDVGTGSGNIAIVLAKHGFSVVATDINEHALKIARNNAEMNGVNIEFIHCSFMENIGEKQSFDYVVSNPPYVARAEYDALDKEVKNEPYEALVSQQNGLWHSLKILEYAREYLKRGGYVFIEISPLRAEKYVEMARHLGYVRVELIRDLNGKYRVLKARWM